MWEAARVMAATRLAAGGGQWTELFSRHNSGTYNNHWMVVDHSKADMWAMVERLMLVISQFKDNDYINDNDSAL